jgi:ankyrin repeat protein
MPNNGRVTSKNPLYNLGASTPAGGRKFTLKSTMTPNPLFGLGASAEAAAGGASAAAGNVSFTSPLPGLVPAPAPAPAPAAAEAEGGSTLNPLSGLGLATPARSGIRGIRNLRNSRTKPVTSMNPLVGKPPGNVTSSKPPPHPTSKINPLSALSVASPTPAPAPAPSVTVNPLRGVRNLLTRSRAENETLSLGEVEVKIDNNEEQLFDAIQANDLAKVTDLIAQGVDINTPRRREYSPLMYAIRKTPGSDMAILLINNGADVNTVYGEGSYTALMIAVLKNKYKIVKELIKNSADINAKTISDDPGANGHRAIFYAPTIPSIESLILLLQSGADVNSVNGAGQTPLDYAVLSALQEKETPISENIRNELRNLGLNLPTNYPAHLSVVRLLLHYGANIKSESGHTSFMLKGVNKSPSLQEALRYNPIEDELVEACIRGRIDILKSLFTTGRVTRETINTYEFDREFDIGSSKEKGFTPLLLALRCKNALVAKYLLENGADPNNSGKYIRPPLCLACFYCSENEEDIINFLIDKGANILQKDTLGYSALDMAIQALSLKNVQIILKRHQGEGDIGLSFSSYEFIERMKKLEGEKNKKGYGEKARAIYSFIMSKPRGASRKSRRATRKSRRATRRATRKSRKATHKNNSTK